jgi:hypothetical protein
MLDFLNHVYVLTLKNKPHEALCQRYDALFPSQYKLFEVEGTPKNANGGEIGSSVLKIMRHNEIDATALNITENHTAMIREAHAQGHENVLFLEDDALFTPLSKEKENRLKEWMQSNSHKWDIFFMGYCPWPVLSSFMVTRDVVRVFTPVCAHAYVLNRSGMEKMLMFLEEPQHRRHHFDKVFQLIPHFRKYAVFPMISFQEVGPALYVKAMDQLGVTVSFLTMCRALEWTSLLVPVILLAIMVLLLVRFFSLLKKN